MNSERLEMNIKGEWFTVRTNNAEPEVSVDELRAAAVRVQEKIDVIMAQSGYNYSVTKSAILAAFSTEIDNEKLRETNSNLRRQLSAIAQDASGSRMQVEAMKRHHKKTGSG
ncbi:MAG: cell division protein ZapA [Oscillospiraceae bacterium]|nr:cell division protein ZapA [Oscillospiraceae bacterium]